MKLIVSGSRDGYQQTRVNDVLDAYLAGNKQLIVIEGCATGVDSQVHDWAIKHGATERFGRHWDWDRERVDDIRLALVHFPAQWKLHGGCRCSPDKERCNYAGHRRNLEMLAVWPDEVVTFHPFILKSKGTKHMATAANERGIRLRQIGSMLPLSGPQPAVGSDDAPFGARE